MAILNSITIGKGRKSLGNVTLQTLGGVTIAKQKIMRNASNTILQAEQRATFKSVLNSLRSFAPVARLAYSRRGTASAFSRFVKTFYPVALREGVPSAFTYDKLLVGASSPNNPVNISEGSKVFSGVRVAPASGDATPAWIEFILRTDMPGAKEVAIGEQVYVKRCLISGVGGSINEETNYVDLTEGKPENVIDTALYYDGGSLVYRTPYFTQTQIPVIFINNERIGLPFEMYRSAF